MALTPKGGLVTTDADTTFTGKIIVNAGSTFHIVDPTDATKVLAFDCSGITTGTTSTFAPTGGTEVTLDGVQTLTNKTLTSPVINTPTIAVLDSALSVKNASDATKIAKFSAASITTATTRTYTLPDVSDTVVTLGAAQTLTGKTLTAPALTAPTVATSMVITSTTGALTLPRMTTTQKAAIATPVAGMLVYDSTLGKLSVYTGSAWEAVTSV